MTSKSTHRFFANLPLLESFFEVSDPDNFHPLPENWFIAITDIVNSSDAIQNGQYKNVNILGASPIVGIMDEENKNQIPFTFGGDGCCFCIPPSMLASTKEVLAASKKIGEMQYGLELRAAVIPVKTIREHGFDVKVASYKVSKVYNQAIFSGGGISYAEELLKNDKETIEHISAPNQISNADFSGLECRWEEVKQEGKKVITLLIKANPKLDNAENIYKRTLSKMRDFFGFDDLTNPIDSKRLNMSLSFSDLAGEVKFRTFGMSWFQKIMYAIKIQIQIILGKIFMALGYQSSSTDWSRYKSDLKLNSDHRKFDDMLRFVISGTEDQFEKLKSFLKDEFEASKLAYGYHVTDSAMITCMVFQYHQQHIHFVDGNEGGYVKAAHMLKQKMAALENG
ncbi:MAG: DUF3095 domain-containing protein [Balneolaceae bacterium]|nr:DUF3095 domain-containing protein [Balneolaceae bacterium]